MLEWAFVVVLLLVLAAAGVWFSAFGRNSPIVDGQLVRALARDERTRALLFQIYTYILQAAPADVAADDIRRFLLQVAGPEGVEDVVNAAQQLIEQGRAEGIERGLERGRAEGLREALTHVLTARSVPLSELGRVRMAACTDVSMLTAWLDRAMTATSEAEVFAGPEGT